MHLAVRVRDEHDRNPYNKLSSKAAQAKREREDARQEKIREIVTRTLEIATARELVTKA